MTNVILDDLPCSVKIEGLEYQFKALFYNLPESTIMAKVMGYRAKKITTTMSRDEIKFYKNMKKLYALKQNKTASEKEQDFADSLWG